MSDSSNPKYHPEWEHVRHAYVENQLSSATETSTLQRVQEHVWNTYQVEKHKESAKQEHPFILQWSLRAAGLSFVCISLFFGWLLWGTEQKWTPVVSKNIQSQTVQTNGTTSDTTRTWSLLTKESHKGRVRVASQWSMHLSRKTHMSIHQIAANKWNSTLVRGFVSVYVIPKKTRTFTIRAHQTQISVLGTRFSVAKGPKWLRVEVTKGRVKVDPPGHKALYLSAYQGVRITRKDQGAYVVRYPIPRLQEIQKRRRIQWMMKHQSPFLRTYISDLLESHQCTFSTCMDWLRESVDRWTRQGRYSEAFLLLKLLQKKSSNPHVRRTNALEMARICWKTRHALPRCIRQYRHTQTLFKQGPRIVRIQLKYFLIHALIQKKLWRQAQKHIRPFLKKYPQSPYTSEVRHLQTQIKIK